MLTAIDSWARRWAAAPPWTNVYGLARSMLALATLVTFVFSDVTSLFCPASGLLEVPMCSGIRGAGLFCLVGAHHLGVARVLVILVLLAVLAGYRPRITGVLHWFVTVSFHLNATMLDGGDQLTADLVLVLVPVTLTDPRVWHWDAPPANSGVFSRFVASAALTMARLQMAGVYFHAATAKFAVPEWTDGTALYYIFLHPTVGVAGWLAAPVRFLVTNAITLPLLTWSVLVLELCLTAAILCGRRRRKQLLAAGLLFHGGIILFHGLVSFGLAMCAGLVLYLWPADEVFDLAPVRRLARTLRSGLSSLVPRQRAGAGS